MIVTFCVEDLLTGPESPQKYVVVVTVYVPAVA